MLLSTFLLTLGFEPGLGSHIRNHSQVLCSIQGEILAGPASGIVSEVNGVDLDRRWSVWSVTFYFFCPDYVKYKKCPPPNGQYYKHETS